MHFVFTLLLVVVTAAANSAAADVPQAPVAKKGDVVDRYHGTEIADPYRWMEDLKSPETLAWMKGQSAHAEGVLQRIPGKPALLRRIQELDKGAPYTVSGLQRLPDGTFFYRKLNAGAEIAVVCARKREDAEDAVVLDPKTYESPGSSHASLEFFQASPDGRFGVAGIAKGGSEVTTLYARDLATGKDLPLAIDRIETAYNVPHWLPDSSGFFYSRRRKLPAGAPASETYKHTVAYLHRLGGPAEDAAVFGPGVSEELKFEAMDFPSVQVFPGSDYLIGQVHHGDAQEVTLYVARRDAIGQPGNPWRKICGPADGVTAFNVYGDHVYLMTSSGAPRYRVVRTPLADPNFARAETVLPESELVLTSIECARDSLFVNATRNGSGVVVQLDPAGKQPPSRLRPPHDLTAGVFEASPYFADIFVSAESWTRGGALYRYDPAKREFQPSPLQPKGAFDDVPGFTSKDVEIPSHDGVLVPLSIIHKEGLSLDGTAPLLLNAYGAYGSIRRAGFSPMNLAWLERGGVIAIAHVRGGGEKGKQWHTGGQKATKPNTWKDAIACAEYLIAQKYTSPGKIAIQGGSAGGIMAGRAITERPDLFRAAVIMVGVTDMLRFETTENGPPNVEEFGSVKTPDGFRALLEMSVLHQVRDGVKYPAVLLTHGLNDRRVDAWMSGKLAARLQEATASQRPVLLLLDTEAGHGIGSMRSQLQEQLASRWSFVLWQVGAAGFQPVAGDQPAGR
jgi:prolyl oligopeptidase